MTRRNIDRWFSDVRIRYQFMVQIWSFLSRSNDPTNYNCHQLLSFMIQLIIIVHQLLSFMSFMIQLIITVTNYCHSWSSRIPMKISWFGDFHFVWTSSIWNNWNMISFETLSQVTCFTNLSLILIANIHFCLDTAMKTLSLMRLNNIGVWINLHLNEIWKSKNICNRFGNKFFLALRSQVYTGRTWTKSLCLESRQL